MTSPLSSLGKNRRMPLQLQRPSLLMDSRKRAVPFKESAQNEDEAAMMDEILGPGAQIPVRFNAPSCSDGTTTKSKSTTLGAAPTDMELLTSMMQKITSLEQKVKSQAHVIQLKDEEIRVLEGQMQILQKGKEESSEMSRLQELEVMCLELQHQVWEMERFLNDYGLIWVGEETDSLKVQQPPKEEGSLPSRAHWKPGDSLISPSSINFDQIFENLKDLNMLAGEGKSQIEHTAGGARLKQVDSVPLTFYQNGIVMFNGPFRSYEDPSTQRCLRDIMDGFFPSELQRRYPDGVPFQVTDKRDIFFRERQLPESFPGLGQVTGRCRPSGLKETNEIPGPKLSLEQFLNRLPKLQIRDGQVINIRGEIGETLQGLSGTKSHEVILVESPSLAMMQKRAEKERHGKAPDSNISTLRIKSENGEKTYVIKMPIAETIGDLRQHLAQIRGEVAPYDILSLFPYRVYNNSSMTLEECGLVPNAALLLRKASSTQLQGQRV
ncbi:UBX domain-containing protein 11 [Hemicordylus capensis]|uniref:UBX domain-containing protein 11 n=1 Tax=Hemicordylus capensis TaxID=884348 RepID=UPI0023037186|nr:UBX domain-containing protein 11 [Hemicordylus capensis]XP_053124501.1 UBX domain-containing protein 11 [Hemicordylus capensis]XP_053124502.1 UBX domain-containing protein 11 [Hemicordylus capensis]